MAKPKGSVGSFKKGQQTIHIIPKKGESSKDAIVRVTSKHGVSPAQVTKE